MQRGWWWRYGNLVSSLSLSVGLVRKKIFKGSLAMRELLNPIFVFHFYNFPIFSSIMAPTLPSFFLVGSFFSLFSYIKQEDNGKFCEISWDEGAEREPTERMTFLISFALTFPVFVLVHYPEYVCHGSWTENDTTFIIARHAGTKHGVCISFKPSSTDSTAAQLIVGDSCYRETMSSEIPEHHLISNVTGIVREYFPIIASCFCSGLSFLIKSSSTLCG